MGTGTNSFGRAVGPAIALAYYGVMAFGLGLASPLAWLLGRELAVQRWVRRANAGYLHVLRRFCLVRFQFSGLEHLDHVGSKLVVANHPSLIDAPVLGAFLDQADLVVNQNRASNPILSGIVRGAGYISNVSGIGVVDECVRRLEAGRCVVMFPEGTRSPESGLGKFHRGAAHVALRSGCDVIPVVIDVEPRKLMKGQSMFDLGEQGLDYRVRILAPVSPSKHLTGRETSSVAARKLTAGLRAQFERMLNDGDQ